MRDSRHKEKGLGGVGAWWEGEGRRGGANRESSIDVHTLLCVKQTARGICCITKGAQLSALREPGGVRWQGGREA